MFLIKSDIRSAVIIVGAFKFPLGIWGKIEASTTLSPSTPDERKQNGEVEKYQITTYCMNASNFSTSSFRIFTGISSEKQLNSDF